MRTTSTNFDTYHALASKLPIVLIHFDGETTDYVNHPVTSPDNTLKKYLANPKSLQQKLVPEQGRSSVGGVRFSLLDVDNEITALLATDSAYFHRKKVTVKVGYKGMSEADMLTEFIGWVTDVSLSNDGLMWNFTITDPQKWLQREIFREAADTSVSIGGNPINTLLRIILSTGAATNGHWDTWAAINGVGLDEDFVDVSGIEKIRDIWFHGVKFDFAITEPIEANKFIETEILKPLNAYPVLTADGKYTIKPYRPPLSAVATVQTFDEDLILDTLPQYSQNLGSMINEIIFKYDWDTTDSEFDTIKYYEDATSITARGPGKKSLKIESKGLQGSNSPSRNRLADEIIDERKSRVFQRYSIPPIKLSFKTGFEALTTEVGDIVPVEHNLLPDLAAGTRGLDEPRMEVISRVVDYDKGNVNFELLQTGFARSNYSAISPSSTTGPQYEDYEDTARWTEYDTQGWLALDYQTITATAFDNDQSARVVADMGSATFFDGDFMFEFQVKMSVVAASHQICLWAVSQSDDDWESNNPSLCFLVENVGVYQFRLMERGSSILSQITGSLPGIIGTEYYIRIWRDESVGTYGTIYADIFTDQERTTKAHATRSVTLQNPTRDYRYVTAFSTESDGGGGTTSTGVVRNMKGADRIRPRDLTPNNTAVSDWDTEKNSLTGWQASGTPDSFLTASAAPDVGDYYFSIVNTSGGKRGCRTTNYMTIINKRTYQLSLSYKVLAGGTSINILVWDSLRTGNLMLATPTPGDTNWHTYSGEFTAEYTTEEALIYLRTNNESGQIRLDNISFIELPEFAADDVMIARTKNAIAASPALTVESVTDGIIELDGAIYKQPLKGSFIEFADYDDVTASQKLYGYLSDDSGNLGAANDDEHLIL